MEAHLEQLGVSIEEVEALATWQADALEAMGRGDVPPRPMVEPGTEILGLFRRLYSLWSFLELFLGLAPRSSLRVQKIEHLAGRRSSSRAC